MTELLFDTYNIPGVCYGVDCLLSYRLKHGLKSGIILGLGYHVSHVIPILEGSPVWEHCRRLNIGGFHAVGLLHRLLQLKYPAHANAVTLSRSEVGPFYYIMHVLCRILSWWMIKYSDWALVDSTRWRSVYFLPDQFFLSSNFTGIITAIEKN